MATRQPGEGEDPLALPPWRPFPAAFTHLPVGDSATVTLMELALDDRYENGERRGWTKLSLEELAARRRRHIRRITDDLKRLTKAKIIKRDQKLGYWITYLNYQQAFDLALDENVQAGLDKNVQTEQDNNDVSSWTKTSRHSRQKRPGSVDVIVQTHTTKTSRPSIQEDQEAPSEKEGLAKLGALYHQIFGFEATPNVCLQLSHIQAIEPEWPIELAIEAAGRREVKSPLAWIRKSYTGSKTAGRAPSWLQLAAPAVEDDSARAQFLRRYQSLAGEAAS